MARSEAASKPSVFPRMIQVETWIVPARIVPNPLTVSMHVRSIRMLFSITEIALIARALFGRALLDRALFGALLFRSALLHRALFLAGWSSLPSSGSRTARWNISAANVILIPAVTPAPMPAIPVLRKP
jgi:hypothetical protein